MTADAERNQQPEKSSPENARDVVGKLYKQLCPENERTASESKSISLLALCPLLARCQEIRQSSTAGTRIRG
jgi:hypothetical protein